jgi:ElaB/YqjD/DUF883 family membrane-anchored ribosome-binding protein
MHTLQVTNEQSDALALAAEEAPNESTASGPDAGSRAAETKVALSGEEILQRMTVIRLRIDEQADELVAQVNALSDWRSYVRRHPWLSVSAAAAIGFVIVPSRAKPGAEDVTRDTPGRATSPAAEELRSVLIGAAKKAATAYASKSIGAFVSGIFDSNERT